MQLGTVGQGLELENATLLQGLWVAQQLPAVLAATLPPFRSVEIMAAGVRLDFYQAGE